MLGDEAYIFEHLLRYRVTTFKALLNILPSYPQGKMRELLNDLVEYGSLLPIAGIQQEVFQVSQTGHNMLLRQLKHPVEAAFRLLEGKHLLRAYGMLIFCCPNINPRYVLYDKARQLLCDNELSALYPSLARYTRHHINFYSETSEKGAVRTGICYIDPGRLPHRLVHEMHDHSKFLAQCEDAAKLRQNMCFGILVAEDEKKKTLQNLFRKWPLPTRPTIVVAPELAEFYTLLAGRH